MQLLYLQNDTWVNIRSTCSNSIQMSQITGIIHYEQHLQILPITTRAGHEYQWSCTINIIMYVMYIETIAFTLPQICMT